MEPRAAPTIRSLTLTVYAPTFVFAVGQGAVIPVMALAARGVGASVALAGVIVALRGIGTLSFDIPAGTLITRIGERPAMVVATLILIVSLVGCVVASTPLLFAVSTFAMGCGWAVWLLARLTYVSEVMPGNLRGRALSTLGGVNRIGNFVGPFVGAVAIGISGVDGAFYTHLVVAVAGCALLFLIPDPHAPPRAVETVRHGVARILHDHRRVFATAGVGAMTIGALRASRQVVLPLWGEHIGLDAGSIAVVFGISAAMDMTLFYPAGYVMDRWGRKFLAVPCIAILAVGQLLVPLTDDFATLAAVGVLLGFGNGMGSGIVMTLGSDFAPASNRAAFLGVWRFLGDVGTAGGPLLVGAVAGAVSLGAASSCMGIIGLAGAVLIATRVPEPLHAIRGEAVLPDPAESP
jgi:MFS family permease